ncbi:Heat shock 70 kDa protein 6 [Hypsibius exemplaris]|uniref:Heat shock 70 kDa protein 6 n=1 Tax=Hypsibius exemplaris TaxID=2072580 RepID=A0A9X6RNJ4_HYPEX|nr:Heat shock 70 kDa protein 6 [Hypsibius exemplaris]
MEEIAMGIDLGTTNCCVSIMRNGRYEIIKSEHSETTTPSYVSFDPEGVLVGKLARSNSVFHPENTIFGIKRIIGKRFIDPEVQSNQERWPFKLQDQDGLPVVQVNVNNTTNSYQPEDISAKILAHIGKQVKKYLNKDVVKAVITVPANFTNSQRRATYEAGKIAGLNVIGMISEPVAAALSYAFDSSTHDQNVLVFDFGDGTLDVAILKASYGQPFQVLSTAADLNLGGEDFDEKILQRFATEFDKKSGLNIRDDSAAMARLRLECDDVKRELSGTSLTARVALASLVENHNFVSSLTRSDFEAMCEDIFRKMLDPVKSALRFVGFSPTDINQVILVGGSSRIPKVREILGAYFPHIKLSLDINPDEAIALGAAKYAQSKLVDRNAIAQAPVPFRDITPHSIGIKSFNGDMIVIIPKGSAIPAKGTRQCTTSVRNQESVRVKVYEGENELADKNNVLGEVVLSGIAPAGAEEPNLSVELLFDMFGCLRVNAEDKLTGAASSATLKSVLTTNIQEQDTLHISSG